MVRWRSKSCQPTVGPHPVYWHDGMFYKAGIRVCDPHTPSKPETHSCFQRTYDLTQDTVSAADVSQTPDMSTAANDPPGHRRVTVRPHPGLTGSTTQCPANYIDGPSGSLGWIDGQTDLTRRTPCTIRGDLILVPPTQEFRTNIRSTAAAWRIWLQL